MAKLPFISSDIPRDLRQFLDRVREAFDSKGANRVVTRGELVSSGVVGQDGSGNLVPPSSGGEVQTPPAPTGLTASGALFNIILDWDSPIYSGHAYTEIWAAPPVAGGGVPALGNASLIGQSPGSVFAHNLGTGAVRYYWIRFVNTLGVAGPYNSVTGTKGETGQDPGYLLDLLEGQITESQLWKDLGARIDLIDADASTEGSVSARVQQEATERESKDSALASLVTTAQATADDNIALIQNEAQARADETGDLFAQYTVKIDLNGYVSGYGLASTNVDGSPESSFVVRADSFAVGTPSGLPGWDVGVEYDVGGQIVYSGSVFASTQKHTGQQPIFYENWNAEVSYSVGDYVLYLGELFYALQASTNVEPVDGTTWQLKDLYWDKLSDSAPPDAWDSAESYSVGDEVIYNSDVYRAVLASANVVPTNGSYWELVSDPTPAPAVPFVVRTRPTTIDGETVPVGVYLRDAFIENGTITRAKIGDAAIDTAKIASIDAGKITTGSLGAGRIDTASIAADSAFLGSLTVDTAQIANAAVDTLNIAGNAATVANFSALESNISGVSGNWRGDWATGTSYAVDDCVHSVDKGAFKCISAHTSDSSNEPEVFAAASQWSTQWVKAEQAALTGSINVPAGTTADIFIACSFSHGYSSGPQNWGFRIEGGPASASDFTNLQARQGMVFGNDSPVATHIASYTNNTGSDDIFFVVVYWTGEDSSLDLRADSTVLNLVGRWR